MEPSGTPDRSRRASDDPSADPQSSSRGLTRRSVDFFRGFLRNPGQVGSVIPSSRFMERRIIDFSELEGARLVVELGPGTGGTTKALLDAMPATGRLLAIDLDPRFTGIVNDFGDPRVVAHTGSAEDLADILAEHGLAAPDAVISGIPFSTMPDDIGSRILASVNHSLAPSGVFVAYQFRAAVARLAEPVFGQSKRAETVMLNIPPMKIWQWARSEPVH